MRKRASSEPEAAIDQSARAVARDEKTLEEHELYVEALLAGTILPPRRRQVGWRVAVGLAAVAAAATSALVLLAVLGTSDQLDVRSNGETQKRAPAPAPDSERDAPATERPHTPAIPRTAALQGAVTSTRQLYLDTTMVSRYQRREKPRISGAVCDPPKAGVYSCRIFEALDSKEGTWGWTTEWEVTIDDQACWTALPLPPPDGHTEPKAVRMTIDTQGTGDAAPLKGCLRDNGRP